VGTSFVRRGGSGFWTRDAVLELWLFLLAREVDRLADPPEWLRAARDHWRLHATAGFTGMVSACLDEHAGPPDRAAEVLRLAERGVAWVREQGPVLPAGLLNSFGLGGPGATFTEDVPAAVFLPAGEAILRLLRGEVLWDADSSPLL
jgi:hypothetical protein